MQPKERQERQPATDARQGLLRPRSSRRPAIITHRGRLLIGAPSRIAGHVSLGADGTLWVNAGYGVWAVCGVAQSWTSGAQTVAPETCRAWYAAMLRQQILGLPIVFYFNDLTSCAAIGSWVVPAPAPYHMDIYGS
jgi:hypothetical protein